MKKREKTVQIPKGEFFLEKKETIKEIHNNNKIINKRNLYFKIQINNSNPNHNNSKNN